MAFEYIGELLEEAVNSVSPVEVRGRVEQVVGTIIRAVVPGVKVGELCVLRNPWEDWSLKAEVVGFVRNVALLSPLGSLQGVSPATEVIPTGEILSIPVGEELLGRVVDGLGQPMDGGPPIKARTHYPVFAEAPNPMTRKIISKPLSLGLRALDEELEAAQVAIVKVQRRIREEEGRIGVVDARIREVDTPAKPVTHRNEARRRSWTTRRRACDRRSPSCRPSGTRFSAPPRWNRSRFRCCRGERARQEPRRRARETQEPRETQERWRWSLNSRRRARGFPSSTRSDWRWRSTRTTR